MKNLIYYLTHSLIVLSLFLFSCSEEENEKGDNSVLTTQSEVENFSGGNVYTLTITGEEITDISMLDVSSVGMLIIKKTSIIELKLPKLTSVTEVLTIENNQKLEKINDFSTLQNLEGTTLINNNPNLTDISGLLDIKKGKGSLTITNNVLLGEDKPLQSNDYSYGLFPVKYLIENNIFEGEIKLSNNHPGAAITVEDIGMLDDLNGHSYVIDSKAAADTFAPISTTIKNLTFTGSEITNEVIRAFAGKINTITGTLLFQDTQITNTEGFVDAINCQGSMIFINNNPADGSAINSNGFRHYTKVGGDLIIQDSRFTFWGEGSSFCQIQEITGSLRIINSAELTADGLGSLKKVGGDFEIRGCEGLWNLSGSQIETIGGDFIYSENYRVVGLTGFESMQSIGGAVVIEYNGAVDWGWGDIPDYGESGRPGWCMIQAWIENGVIKDPSKVSLKRHDGEPVDLTGISPCDPYDPFLPGELRSYEINGLDELERFIAGATSEKETVVNLTIRGEDITDGAMSRVQARVGTITGTLTWESLHQVTTTENFFEVIDCQGSIVIKDFPGFLNPNGLKGYTKIGGDFIVEDCYDMPADWDGWKNVVEVEGSVRFKNFQKSMNGASWNALKRVGGDFEFERCKGGFWDFNGGMKLEEIGGSLIIKENEAFENLIGLETLTSIGGDIIIWNNPNIPNETDWRIGYCLIKHFKDTGIVHPEASIQLGTEERPVTIDSLTPCTGL